ncbi:MAG: protein kinase [Byssovorax sp.]
MATCPTCRVQYGNDVSVCPSDGERLLPDEAFEGADHDLRAGQQVGEYQIEGKLGEGGFGAVYRAVHPLIGKTAAIKVLNRQYSSSPQMVSRFIAEARAVNQIRNRNIIDIFSFGKLDDGRQYYVMELLDGVTFDRYLRDKGRLRPDEAIPLLRGIARALDAAHAAGIAHRDLKPENIFLVFEDGAVSFPKLLDFGIAKLLGETMSGHKTRTGAPMGTPHYMSPEQCRGRDVDHRTDIYSFGVMTHQVLTGQLPFDAEDVMSLLIKHTSEAAPRVSSVCPDLPAALDAPVLHMLEKEPARRPASLLSAVDALADAAAGVGYSVQSSQRRGAFEPQSFSGGAPPRQNLTPADLGKLVEAQTMAVAGGTQHTLKPAEKGARGGAGPRVALVAGLALLIGGGGAALLLARQGSPGDKGIATAAPLGPSTVASAPPPKVPEPAISVSPATSTEVAPAAPAEIELTIDATPKLVEVFRGTEKIGTSAAPIRVPRSDGKVKLTFKSPGFSPLDLEVSAGASAVVPVRLERAGPAVKKPTNKPEVEF